MTVSPNPDNRSASLSPDQEVSDCPSVPPQFPAGSIETGPEEAAHNPSLSPPDAEEEKNESLPTHFGCYRIVTLLGSGGFGSVYKAFDEDLQRDVAIKVPHRQHLATAAEAAAYLAEARILASLEHPHIVPVHTVGRTPEGLCFIVSKFIAGSDLAKKIKQAPPTLAESISLVAIVADALHYAHGRRLVHRDVKPGNILIDESGKPYLTDFGLALKEEDVGKGSGRCGTPAYMSPEQANGEGHRVDGRSDIFSLRVVLYELLTGQRPFRGLTTADILVQVVTQEARPPRQLDDTIPKELERICLKALAKRASERYTTAKDLAEELRLWQDGERRGVSPTVEDPLAEYRRADAAPLAEYRRADAAPLAVAAETGGLTPPRSPASDSERLKIVPKGLRSFDATDADFFLELLPGPRDREGLPDTIRFWKNRIEERDPENTFAVGLIYGPSGCGKSSLVKAGLLPRLARHVLPVYVEAAAEETESRLLNRLRKLCPELPAHRDLNETLAALRLGQGLAAGRKVLLVVDQFEQWLHAQRDVPHPELVQALRQCDSQRVQALVLVRDDFWMAATRFMRGLDIRLVEGQNSAAVDLFPPHHAEKVLAAFGRAFGVLPDQPTATSRDQQQFLAQAVAGLTQEGKIICVRLALFAEMMKGKPWTPATLKAVGGAQGVGVTFLEETFSARTAPPEHRYHQEAARAVLKALLPEAGTDIKGHLRSRQELLAASAYGARPRDFEDLLRILDSELRLITPTDESSVGERRGVSPPVKDPVKDRHRRADAAPLASAFPEQFYQLTHDYLVPSLRDWLTRKQKETRRGRAELLLADWASVWSARPENRQLPSLPQWFSIQTLVRKQDWTAPQRQMMRRATRVHVFRAGVLVLVLALLGIGSWQLNGRLEARHLVQTLATAETPEVPKVIARLRAYRRWAEPLLMEQAAAESETRERVRACLALTAWNAEHVDFLAEQLLKAPPDMLPILIQGLAEHGPVLRERYWVVLQGDRVDGSQRLRAAGALAAYDSDDPRWEKVSGDVVRQLVTEHQRELPNWAETLRPVHRHLLAPLVTRTAEAEAGRFPPLVLLLREYRETAVPLLEKELERTSPAADPEEKKDTLAKQQARVAAALVQLGQPEKVWPMLQHHGPDPRRRSYLLNLMAPLGVEPELLVQRLEQERDVTARRALLLSLGESADDQWLASLRRDLIGRLLTAYRDDADAGIHSARSWLLRHWGQGKELERLDRELVTKEAREERQWYVNSQGQTYAVIRGPVEVTMGSPPGQVGHFDDETLHTRRIPRSFAIATAKVTLAQFRKFEKNPQHMKQYGPEEEAPVNMVTWHDAARYCNWLSQQEGLPPQQWCYEARLNVEGMAASILGLLAASVLGDGRKSGEPEMKLAPDYLHRKGYRLPTEAEWEYACRAGAQTAYCFGETEELLDRYGWYSKNAAGRSHPVGVLKPNDLGLFDAHGNLWEWCLNRYQKYPKETKDSIEDKEDVKDLEDIKNNDIRVLRGGAFLGDGVLLRSAHRTGREPAVRYGLWGFRPARTYP